MPPRLNILSLLFLLLAVQLPVRAQQPVHVQVETNLPEAIVFADSLRLGPASQGSFYVPAVTQHLRLVAERIDAWSISPISRALHAQPGDTVAVRMDFPYYYQIETMPFGADVFAETGQSRRRLGETPFLYQAEEPLMGALSVEKNGYVPQRVENAGEKVWNYHSLVLEPVEPKEPVTAEVDWNPPVHRHRWIDWTALGIGVAAGVLSVHYKFKADRQYAAYQETGDPALRPSFERYDDRAGIALGVMQVGVGVFALRLILR